MHQFTVRDFILFCFVSFALLQQNVTAKSTPVQLTFFYSHQPPFEFTNNNGSADGIAIKLVRSLFSDMGASVTFEFNSVNRGVANLHNGIYDISTAVSPSDNIRQQFWVSDKALYPIEFIAIHKPTTPPISAILKQNNVTFAALSENTFPFIDRFFAAHTDIKRYDVSSMQQGLKLVEADKMPYFLTYASGDDELTESQYQIDVIEKMPVHLVVSKQHPQGKALIDKINAALSLIVNS